MILTEYFILVYPIFIVFLVAYVLTMVKKKGKEGLRKQGISLKVLIYLSALLILLAFSTRFNESHYMVDHQLGKLIGSYNARVSGYPFSFLQISDTEICSGCDEIKILMKPFLLNVAIFSAIILTFLRIIEKRLKPTRNKLLIVGAVLVAVLVEIGLFIWGKAL